MGYARGIDLLTVDSEGRISASKIIKEYLRIKKREGNRDISEGDEENLKGYIGLEENEKLPVLVLVNEDYANTASEKVEENKNVTIKSLRSVADKEDSVSYEKKFYRLFRKFDVVTNKIRLTQFELNTLGISKQKRKVIVEGDEIRFLIWPLEYYQKHYASFYQRIGPSEEGKDEK